MNQSSLLIRSVMLAAALAPASTAFAFGMGDLSVSSHLGQSLNARVELLDVPSDVNPDCFKLGAVADSGLALPNDISFKLEQSGKRANLRIQTKRPVNEPALMLTVSAACPEQIQREYAILLDPPAISETPIFVAETGAAKMQDEARPAATSRQSRPKKSSKSARSADGPKTAGSSGKPRRQTDTSSAEGPRLIISGNRRIYSPNAAQLALNLDVGLLDTSRRAAAPLTADEITDENTALTRKVAHLEELLTNLQQRNTELEQARTQTKKGAVPAPAAQPAKSSTAWSSWPYLLLGFVLFAAAAAYLLSRRRQHAAIKEETEAAIWRAPPTPLSMQSADEVVERPNVIKQPKRLEPSLPSTSAAVKPIAPTVSEGTEVKDSVADEVEVFVAHGHSDLAIHMLEDHIEKAPEESPVPWLLLLDLLKREGAQAKYEEYREKSKLHFNVALPAFDEVESSPSGQGLESYAHIMSELVRLWQTDEANAYLDDLIYDRRGGSRVGFDPVTYRDIVLLRSIRSGDHWQTPI